MVAITTCDCPTTDFYGKKVHKDDCLQTCPHLTTKDRYSVPKRCGKVIKRTGLCCIHAGRQERLERKHKERINA